jgi:DNA replication protein DnaC
MITPKQRRDQRAAIAQRCRRLSWSQTAVDLCAQATPSQEAFLLQVLDAELAHREVSRRARLLTRAGFPAHKTLADFDRHGVRLPSTLTWDDLDTGAFLVDHRNLVCYGPVGVGKTHLAIALGVAACERGQSVAFFTVTGLVVRLTEARRAGTLERFFKDLQRLDLVILDEWGYLPIDREGAQLLFRVVADCYETRSLIILPSARGENKKLFFWG